MLWQQQQVAHELQAEQNWSKMWRRNYNVFVWGWIRNVFQIMRRLSLLSINLICIWIGVEYYLLELLLLTIRILRIQKQVIRSMVGVSARTSCRQLFKELNILTLVSLYIMEVICYVRKHRQFVDLNSNIHAHNTWRKMDNHIRSHNTDLHKRSVMNMGNCITKFLGT
jgi:hypothetical protein